jgi:hypothetical protein
MDKGFLYVTLGWLIICILYFGWKWIKEKRREVNYINILKSLKKEKRFIENMTNEIKVLREFLLEFNPYYDKTDLEDMNYTELVNAVKETVKEM